VTESVTPLHYRLKANSHSVCVCVFDVGVYVCVSVGCGFITSSVGHYHLCYASLAWFLSTGPVSTGTTTVTTVGCVSEANLSLSWFAQFLELNHMIVAFDRCVVLSVTADLVEIAVVKVTPQVSETTEIVGSCPPPAKKLLW